MRDLRSDNEILEEAVKIGYFLDYNILVSDFCIPPFRRHPVFSASNSSLITNKFPPFSTLFTPFDRSWPGFYVNYFLCKS